MSYTLNDWRHEDKTKSTETLGIGRNGRRESDDERSDTGHRKTRTLLIVSGGIIVLLLVVCIVLSVFLGEQIKKQQQQSKEVPTENGNTREVYCYSPECLQLAADFSRNMNTSLDPCEDFFQYSCGSWIKDHPIPPSKNMLDTFIELDDKNFQRMREMLEEADQLPEKGAVKKAKLYFKSCLSEEDVEKTAKQSLSPLIAKYGSWALDNQTWNSTEWDWLKVLPAMSRLWGTTPLFRSLLDINPRNSSQYILAVSCRFVSLPLLQSNVNTSNVVAILSLWVYKTLKLLSIPGDYAIQDGLSC